LSVLDLPEPEADDPLEAVGLEDPFAVELALSAPQPLAALNRSGALVAADIHAARRLAEIAEVSDPEVLVAVALTVAAARSGHAYVELEEVAITSLGSCPRLIATDPQGRAPLRLEGSRLYLDRYWREERRLAAALLQRNRMRADVGDLAKLGERIVEVVRDEDAADQRLAVAVAMLRELTVLAGGPGTGKTTTVAWIVQLTLELAREAGLPQPLIALCAPTGKAAARLNEAVAGAAPASTIHRLLGWLPGGRFRHDARNRLPHDLVIVDETSMVPLSLMTRLVEAVRDDARLVLVGDPDQLAAIEVGAVLRDIVGDAAAGPRFGLGMRVALERVTGEPVGGVAEPRAFGDCVAVLRRGHRSVEAISSLAEAIRRGDGDGVLAELDHRGAVVWLPAADGPLDELKDEAVAALAPMVRAALAGDAPGALRLLRTFRLMCAHRHGPYGMAHWGTLVQTWLREALPEFASGADRYPGLPLLATRNDYELQLRNGDTGVVIAAEDPGDGTVAVFDTSAGQVELAPSRLANVEPLYAATVYRSQGSEFDVAALVLPESDSPLLTRELIYTGITRARSRLILIGSEESVRTAVARPAGRASGLAELLWTDALSRPA
jgi:exodeoxyribonuclease V alpha subunit